MYYGRDTKKEVVRLVNESGSYYQKNKKDVYRSKLVLFIYYIILTVPVNDNQYQVVVVNECSFSIDSSNDSHYHLAPEGRGYSNSNDNHYQVGGVIR